MRRIICKFKKYINNISLKYKRKAIVRSLDVNENVACVLEEGKIYY